MSHRVAVATIVTVTALVLAACGGESPAPPPAGPGNGDVASIQLDHGDLAFASLGLTTPIVATARDNSGSILAGATYSWTRHGSGAVQVSNSGVITTVANGIDTVTAAVGAVKASIEVRVQQQPAAVTLVSSRSVLALALQHATLTASVVDANSRPITGAQIDFSSSNPDALPVSTDGVVTAAQQGDATITATAGAINKSINLSARFTGPFGAAITGQPVACNGGAAGPFPCQSMTLVSYLPVSALGGGPGVELNDIWGWTDAASGKEYVMVGRDDGVAFVDVSDGVHPRLLGFLPITPGSQPNFWHDIKVYHDHAYIVADGAGAAGMQVFDLAQLRNVTVPKVFTPETVYTGVASSHNMVIDTATGFGFIVGANGGGNTCGGGLHMVDLRQPEAPSFAGCFNDPTTGRAGTGYTHDAQCTVYHGPDPDHQGAEICFGLNETALSIADVTNKSAPVALSHVSYPEVAYSHQGWLTDDQRYLFTNDELDEIYNLVPDTRTLIWDVADLDDPVLAGQYLGPTPASDHNNYIVGNMMYASNYQYGIRVLDIGNPLAPVQVGHFDTAPDEPNLPGFGGSWSNYPFFASGNVVVTSGTEGLFVLRLAP